MRLTPGWARQGTILAFHRLRDPGAAFAFDANRRNCVPQALFGAVLDWLADAGIEVVGMQAALDRLRSGDDRRFVCLTFDDGYRDNHDLLLPIARARGVPVAVYVTPGLLDGTAPLWWYGLEQAVAGSARIRLPLETDAGLPARTAAEKAAAFDQAAAFMLRADAAGAAAVAAALADRYGVDFPALARLHMMDWDMVRALAASPLVEIGAHTVTHPPLARRGRAEASREMADSRERLEAEIGRPIRHFAYPFGTATAAGAREASLAAELGFATAVTLRPGHVTLATPVHVWPRIGIGPATGRLQLRLKLAGVSALRARLGDAFRSV